MDFVKDSFRSKGFKAFDTEKKAGRIKHVDKTEGNQTRAYLDWFILSDCDRLVISQSGFSETAAKYSCKPMSFYHAENMDLNESLELKTNQLEITSTTSTTTIQQKETEKDKNNESLLRLHFVDLEYGNCHPKYERFELQEYLKSILKERELATQVNG